MAQVCDRCKGENGQPSRRYCKGCEAIVKGEMKATGYLAPAVFGHVGTARTNEQREDTRATKYGLDR